MIIAIRQIEEGDIMQKIYYVKDASEIDWLNEILKDNPEATIKCISTFNRIGLLDGGAALVVVEFPSKEIRQSGYGR